MPPSSSIETPRRDSSRPPMAVRAGPGLVQLPQRRRRLLAEEPPPVRTCSRADERRKALSVEAGDEPRLEHRPPVAARANLAVFASLSGVLHRDRHLLPPDAPVEEHLRIEVVLEPVRLESGGAPVE